MEERVELDDDEMFPAVAAAASADTSPLPGASATAADSAALSVSRPRADSLATSRTIEAAGSGWRLLPGP